MPPYTSAPESHLIDIIAEEEEIAVIEDEVAEVPLAVPLLPDSSSEQLTGHLVLC